MRTRTVFHDIARMYKDKASPEVVKMTQKLGMTWDLTEEGFWSNRAKYARIVTAIEDVSKIRPSIQFGPTLAAFYR